MKEMIAPLISAIASVVVAILGAQWFSPELLRIDLIFPSKDIKILDDFVYVQFAFYVDKHASPPIEKYYDRQAGKEIDVYDKVSYMEHVSIKKSKAKYQIRLGSAEIFPQIVAISPPLRNLHYEVGSNGSKMVAAELDVSQADDNYGDAMTPNPKMLYVYRNGYQEGNTYGGKNVTYDTDKLTFVYDFTTLDDWEKKIEYPPQVCLKRKEEDAPTPLPVKWENGVAVAEARALKSGDKVRIYWAWRQAHPSGAVKKPLSCEQTMS